MSIDIIRVSVDSQGRTQIRSSVTQTRDPMTRMMSEQRQFIESPSVYEMIDALREQHDAQGIYWLQALAQKLYIATLVADPKTDFEAAKRELASDLDLRVRMDRQCDNSQEVNETE